MKKIAGLCPTHNRPRLLGRLIGCFLEQDHPNCELVILDDAGQYGHRQGDRWKIISTSTLYPSVGAKRNELARMTDADYLCPWDDDDLYLPWALSACAAALDKHIWAQPSQALEQSGPAKFTRYLNHNPGQEDYAYGAQWSYRRREFLESGGYPLVGNGDDSVWMRTRARPKFGPSGDTISDEYPLPFYVYTREFSGSWHASELGPDREGIEKIWAMPVEDVSEFRIVRPPELDIPIPDEILPRKW